MGCSGCSSGRGCSTLPKGCNNNGSCGTGGCNKLNTFDWLANMAPPTGSKIFDVVEVRFKNSRKEFFKNAELLPLQIGDVIAVEAASGHDIGIVSLSGELVRMQMKKKGVSPESKDIKKIYRKARQTDIDRWIEAQNLENSSMQFARKKAQDLGLQMKIGDVEYQGDKTKATFYYIADDRVDFRELIKILADELKVRIEMRQIGSRQEAGRIGGIGSCGRELCCSTWLTDFRTVNTTAARYQQLSINPLKLAGQCGKLKCCLNYELDTYLDALKDFPNSDIKLMTKKGDAVHQKTDVFKKTIWYTYLNDSSQFIPLHIQQVKKIIDLNKKGVYPESLQEFSTPLEITNSRKELPLTDLLQDNSVDRFFKKPQKKSSFKRKNGR